LGQKKVPHFKRCVDVDNPISPKNSRYGYGFLDGVIRLFSEGLKQLPNCKRYCRT